ncbi:MAG: Grx4 family monothiol glutaredoxin [bacterium]
MPSFKNIFKVVGQEQADSAPPAQGGDVSERISSAIKENRILIFMKGNPEFPQCGFSAATIDVFNQLGEPYATRDVLQDPEIRQGIKEFSNWPTIPQVFIDGKFIGGCDIITEMHQTGELEPLVKKG